MGIITSLINVARAAWGFIAGLPSDIGRAVAAVWSFARSVQQVADYVLSHPLTELLNAMALWSAWVTGNHQAYLNAIIRIDPWIFRHRVLPLKALVQLWFRQLEARIAYLFAQAYLYIDLKFRQAEAYTRQLVDAEHKDMLAHFREAEHYAYLQALARYQQVNRESASAYNGHLQDRLGLARRLTDEIVARDPAVSGLVKAIVTGIVDLAGIEDPLARLALGFLLRTVIRRLGVDKPVAALLDSLLAPLLGSPRARSLPDVVTDLELRTEATEQWEAQFMADGGPEILQAGQDWKDLTSVVTDVALLAFLAATIAEPVAAANDVNRVLVPVADGAAAAWRALLR